MKQNHNLIQAKVKRNDEFYTLYEDIQKELPHYHAFLKGKTVYCNCDNPEKSQFVKYFQEHFQEMGLQKLIVSCYVELVQLQQLSLFGTEESILTFSNQGANYLEMTEQGISVKPLHGNGDFRSYECMELMKQADVLITNPPFSLIQEWLEQVSNLQKDFLIIANLNMLSKKYIFQLFQTQKLHFGKHAVKQFLTPDGTVQSFGNTYWFTSFPVTWGKPFQGTAQFHQHHYLQYENYPAIHTDSLKEIPIDYDGEISVPITYLRYHNPQLFELVGMASSDFIPIQKIPAPLLQQYFQEGGTGHYTSKMRVLCLLENGTIKFPFSRVIIRKRKHD